MDQFSFFFNVKFRKDLWRKAVLNCHLISNPLPHSPLKSKWSLTTDSLQLVLMNDWSFTRSCSKTFKVRWDPSWPIC